MDAAEHPLGLLVRVNGLQALRRIKAIRSQSPLLLLVISMFITGYAVLAFWLFRRGLGFVSTFPGLGAVLIERLIYLLFAFVLVLLIFSNLVISFTNLFRNRETAFLLSLPVPVRTIFQWKLMESTVLASWAFLFLIAPLLAAYGLTRGVPWHFYAVTLLFVGLFILLPAAAGSWLAVNLARYVDRRLFQIAGVTGAIVALAGAAVWLQAEPVTDEMLETRVLTVLDRLLAKTRFSQFPFLPSYWVSSGLLQWAEGARVAAVFFGLVLLSHVLFFGYLAFTRMGGAFYDAVSAVNSRGSVFWQWPWFRRWQRRRRDGRWSPGLLDQALGRMRWLPSDLRAIAVKDLRVFWRDTTQWGQTLVLFGLLGAYVLNLRHFSQQLTHPFWVHLISFLNLGACALNLATLTTRFVYPQFSLEGKRLWIIGMAPLGIRRVLLTKYWLASIASLAVTLSLMVLSCWMLRLPAARTIYFGIAISVMTFTLNGLGVGLGALHPNFKEDHPGKIVSGFGGTFCLVLSFLYILASVVLLAVGSPWSWSRWESTSPALMAVTWTGFVLLSVLLGWLPLKLALRRVTTFEL